MVSTTRKRGVYLSAAMVAALVLAACSGTPDDGVEEPEAEDVAEGVTTINFWQVNFNDEENEWYEGVVDAYNESQDEVHVQHTIVPGDAWDQRMTAAQAAGNAPDLYTQNYGAIVDAARTNQIQSLSSLISDEAWDDLQDNVRGFVTFQGEEYAYPLLVEPSAVLYYRTDLFEEAGIAAPPTDWDELIDYAERLSTDEVFGIRLAQESEPMSWSTWGYQYNVAGQLPISDDWSEPMATDAYAPLLQAFQDLFASGALPPADGQGYPNAQPYGEGRYAMMANGSWAASQLMADYPEIAEVTEVAPMPSFDGQSGRTTATLGGWTWVVDGNSDNAEEAAAFIEWALGGDPDNVVPFFEATVFSKVSARVSVGEAIEEFPGIDDINPWNAIIQEEVVPYAEAEPAYPWNVSLAMGEAIEEAMQGMPVDQALAEANAKIEAEIANSDLAGNNPDA
jgi:multiple sugar transport system substrate-binding protein